MADKTAKWIKDLGRTTEGRMLLERERVFVDATESLADAMESKGVNKAQLADRLKVSRPWITQMLSGTGNLTLGTLSDAYFALGYSLHVGFSPLGTGRIRDRSKGLRSLHIGAPDWTHETRALSEGWSPEPRAPLPSSGGTPHNEVAA
jgi:transcriptional regulator with XRE-family HTH domain